MGLFQDLRIEALPETDGGGFQEPAALAQRRLPIDSEKFEMRFGIAAPLTALAFNQKITAMKLQQPARTRARQRVKPINVLRHH
jgi:hypothetical protein